MQCVLREKLLAQAMRLAEISSAYRSESHRFVELYFAWLEQAEKDLAGLRSPIGILLQAEKSSLASVLDGNFPHNIESGTSIRKRQKAAAAQSLEKMSREIYAKIENIDRDFGQLSEKMCHAVAVLATKQPQLYERLQASQETLDAIWQLLGRTPETMPMYNYFCAKLGLTDRNYLLMDIIQNVVSNRAGAGPGLNQP